jgi:hypothetical protein
MTTSQRIPILATARSTKTDEERTSVTIFSSPRRRDLGFVSDAATLDNHNSAANGFTLISKAASNDITESEAADPGMSPLFLYVTLSHTLTQSPPSNPSRRESARWRHNQEGEKRLRLTEGDE